MYLLLVIVRNNVYIVYPKYTQTQKISVIFYSARFFYTMPQHLGKCKKYDVHWKIFNYLHRYFMTKCTLGILNHLPTSKFLFIM